MAEAKHLYNNYTDSKTTKTNMGSTKIQTSDISVIVEYLYKTIKQNKKPKIKLVGAIDMNEYKCYHNVYFIISSSSTSQTPTFVYPI
jgi:predicted ATP-grasp superfamily ATP-dependent carboligase